MKSFKLYRQLEMSDCGPACIQMVSAFWGKKHTLHSIKNKISVSRIGVTIGDINRACEEFGLNSIVVQGSAEQLSNILSPVILHWRGNHFVVLYNVKKKGKRVFYIADPAFGKLKFAEDDFKRNWYGEDGKGIAVVTKPTEKFYFIEEQKENNSIVLRQLLNKLALKKNAVLVSLICIIVAILCNWLSPIVFQKIIDWGVLGHDVSIVWKLFLVQMSVFLGYIIFNSINTFLLTKLNFNIGIEYLSELLGKIIRLPLKYFETRLNTEFIQRFDDYLRLQSFLTEKSIGHLLSIINVLVFSAILGYYNIYMFFIFLVGSVIGFFWNFYFLEERKFLDYSRFTEQARNRNILYELINGMPDIKIFNAQKTQVSQWESNQSHINEISLRSLLLNNKQSVGGSGINKLCEITILGLCCVITIKSDMSLGTLISINYILGQLSVPLVSLLRLPQDIQDARISLARLAEVQLKEDEDSREGVNIILKDKIEFKDVTFKYEGSFNPNIFDHLSLSFKKGQMTAIVGNSGSGKTTLVKILLGLYLPQKGSVLIDDFKLNDIDINSWRICCGAVMQDGYIFSGTIAENIALGDKNIDYDRVKNSAVLACIDDFISRLPSKYDMKIGKSGLELSQGQKQRILIARAIYKNPQLLIFDEATSSLDTVNERRIMDNLNEFFKNRTVIVVAHRLSTVVRADNIIFLDNGKIAEQGTHKELVARRGKYFELIKNQLELEQ